MDDETIIGFSDTATHQPESKQKNGKRSGGFQAMGLSFPVLKGVLKRGYKVPTPIQRKVWLDLRFLSLVIVLGCVLFLLLIYFRQFRLLWKTVTLLLWLERVVEKLHVS